MIAATGFDKRNVAVLGLGKSGLATVRALEAGGANVFAWDDSEAKRSEAKLAGFRLSDPNGWDWTTFSALILSPGIPLTHPVPHEAVGKARAANVEVIGDVELFQRAVNAAGKDTRVVAITGTNGKSTTTALIGHMVRRCGGDAQVGGNIGRAVLDLDAPEKGIVYVVEVSSYQIDLAPGLAPDIAVLLNITPDHIDRHGTLEHYADVKARIFARQGVGDTAVIGVDDAMTSKICTQEVARRAETVVPVSIGKALSRGVYVLDGVIYDSTGTQAAKVGDLREIKTLAGAHNWQNAAAAYAACKMVGIAPHAVMACINSYPGLVHRQEPVEIVDGVGFVNDSKATNGEAAARALACYDDIYWIIGGRPKEGGLKACAPYYERIRKAYLIGEAAMQFSHELDGEVPFTISGDLETATKAAFEDARKAGLPEAVVLLSPACASFDQFTSFEERGDLFRDIVEALPGDHMDPFEEPGVFPGAAKPEGAL